MEELKDRQKVRIEKVSNLILADWNYKSDGTQEMIQKLANSISLDKSAGILAVRKMKSGKYEVIDGNHRLKAILLLGWEQVFVEDFGSISKATAVIISKRRNDKWFDSDNIALAQLFKEDVLKEYSIDDLEKIMPDTREEIENFTKLLDFDWNKFQNSNDNANGSDEQTLSFHLSLKQYASWKEQHTRIASIDKTITPTQIFSLMLNQLAKMPDKKIIKEASNKE